MLKVEIELIMLLHSVASAKFCCFLFCNLLSLIILKVIKLNIYSTRGRWFLLDY
jgi:hypothetical protein